MHTPLGILTEVLLGDGTWENISTRARGPSTRGIKIVRARKDLISRTSPTTVNLTIEDAAGDFNDLNPLSPYYGLIGPNTQLRVSTGSSGALSDDFGRVVADAWTGGNFAWTITTSAGAADADFDINGASATQTNPSTNVLHYATADTGQPDHRVRTRFNLSASTLTGAPVSLWLFGRFTDINNYYAAHVEMRTDGGLRLSIYKRVGGVLTQVHTASADFDTSTNFTTDVFMVEFYVEGPKLYAKAWDAATDEPAGWMLDVEDGSLEAGNGAGVGSRRETSNTNANLQFAFASFLAVPGTIRAHVEIPNLGASEWTHGGKDVTMSIQGAGIMRRLGQGAKAFKSPMTREISRSPDLPSIVGWWPGEETGLATQIASGLPGGVPLSITGTDISFGSSSTFPGTSSLIQLGTGTMLRANVLSSPDTGQVRAQCLIKVPTGGLADGTPLLEVSQAKDTAIRKWRLLYATGGDLRLVGYTQGGTLTEDTGAFTFDLDDNLVWVGFTVEQNGANVDWAVRTAELGSDGSAVAGGVSGTFITSSVGAITGAVIAPTRAMGGCLVGQFILANDTAAFDLEATSLIAHLGETSPIRFARLCTEENIAYEVVGSESAASSVQMGAQRTVTLLQNLQDCEDAEGGILYEPRHFFGLAFRTHETLYNQTGPEFSYPDGYLTGEPFPKPDEVLRANDVAAVMPNGSEFRSTEETGPMSIQDPPNGIGRYDKLVPSPVRNAVDLPNIARWNRHVGTWRGPRYPTITLETHRQVFVDDLVLSAQVDALDIGDFLSVLDLPAWLPPEPNEVLTLGYSEEIENLTRKITFNAVPAGPYLVARRGTTFHRDSLASTVNTNAASGATSLSVAVVGPLWVTGAVDFNIMVSGSLKHVTNISGASSPQTFTMDASAVNGIDKALTVGDEVHIYPRPVRGLTSFNYNGSTPADATGDLVIGRDTPPAVWAEGEGTGVFTSGGFIEDVDPVGVTFTVPSTGAVLVHIAGELDNDAGTGFTVMSFNVRSTSEIGGGTLRLAASDLNAILVLAGDQIRTSKTVRLDNSNVSQFLAGREYNIVLAHRRVTAGNASIRRRILLVTPDKVQGGLPGSAIGAEPASAFDVEDVSDTSTSTAYTAADMNVCGMSFVAPPSGKVIVRLSARMDNSGASSCFVSYRIGTAGVVGAGTQIVAPDDTRAIEHFQVNQIMVGAAFPVTGLTAGDTYNAQMMHRASAGTITLENRQINVEPVS